MNARRMLGGCGRLLVAGGLGVVPLPGSHASEIALLSSYERWSLDGDPLSEASMQLTLDVDFAERWEVALSTGFAAIESDVAPDLSGATDTRARVSYRPTDQLALRVGLNGPTGQNELSGTELATARLLSDRLLALPSRLLGQGFDIDMGGACAIGAGAAAFGLGAGYLVKGDFTPEENGPEYQPGDRFSVSLGADVGSPSWLLRNSVTYARYAADELDGEEFIQSGDTWDAEAVILRRFATWSGWFAIRRLQIGEPDPRVPGLNVGAINARSESETALTAGAEVSRPAWRLDASLGVRFFSGNAAGNGEARRVDVGVGSRLRLMSALWGEVGGRISVLALRDWSAELQLGEDADVTGGELTVGLRTGF